MYNQVNFRSAVCEECSLTGAPGADHRNRLRLAGLKQNHKVSIVSSGSDPRHCCPLSPRCFGTDWFCLEGKVPQVGIPIIINYHQHYSQIYKINIQNWQFAQIISGQSVMLSLNKHKLSVQSS